MSGENKEKNSGNTEEIESGEDSILKDLNALEQLLQDKEVPEQELIEEIADMAEGNLALAKRTKGSSEKGRGLQEMIQQEQQKDAGFIAEKESEIRNFEELVSNAEKKIGSLVEADKDDVSAKLEKIQEKIAERKKNLEKVRLEQKDNLTALEKTIISHNTEQEEISLHSVDYAIKNVMEGYKIYEDKTFNLDEGALKGKVEAELKAREGLKESLDYIESKQPVLEQYENFMI